MIPVLTPQDRLKPELAGLILPSRPLAAPKVTHIIAPIARGTAAKRKHAMTVAECRDQNICQYCRVTPAKFFGEGIGYAAGCPLCTVANAAASMRKRRATHGR